MYQAVLCSTVLRWLKTKNKLCAQQRTGSAPSSTYMKYLMKSLCGKISVVYPTPEHQGLATATKCTYNAPWSPAALRMALSRTENSVVLIIATILNIDTTGRTAGSYFRKGMALTSLNIHAGCHDRLSGWLTIVAMRLALLSPGGSYALAARCAAAVRHAAGRLACAAARRLA